MNRATTVFDQAVFMFERQMDEVRYAGYQIEGDFWTVRPEQENRLLNLALEVVGFRARLGRFYNTPRPDNTTLTQHGDQITVTSDRYWITRIAHAKQALAMEIGAQRASLATGDRVTVYLNNNFRDASTVGYRTHDTVTEVFTYGVRFNDPPTLGHGFDLLNIGHEPEIGQVDDRAVAYRCRILRSLCVGDVLAVYSANDESTQCYACHHGSEWLPIEPPKVAQHREYGVTPVEDDLTPL